MLKIREVSSSMAHIIHKLQKESFEPLLNKYHDYDINPAMESIEQIIEKIDSANATTYIFQFNDINVGCVRIREVEDKVYKVSALCVLPEYQNKGIAQEALKQIEGYHPNVHKWILSTILQEKGNCYLYEKIGYVKTGEVKKINEKMEMIDYVKLCKV
ncbi:MAG: GNAT family N-acetyltransferase [Gudongella sp.]|nr:GNAT family N-acetyltransferase [Gudongella sp.]